MSGVKDHKGKVYEFENLIGVAKRENNPKRQFLFINRNQGKYVPANPAEAIEMFHTLGDKVAEVMEKLEIGDCEKPPTISVIGFAETATALGAFAAEALGEDTYYLHTTRREEVERQPLIRFEEEHSHATSHHLYCEDPERFYNSDVIVLFDDEFTTGKTIRNLVEALRNTGKCKKETKFIAASILNCMNEENLENFKSYGIECAYLIKKEDIEVPEWKADEQHISESHKEVVKSPKYKTLYVEGRKQLNIGISMGEYRQACNEFSQAIIRKMGDYKGKNILVLGTEEIMYPAIWLAHRIQETNNAQAVKVQATGRSPILAFDKEEYPIRTREKIISIYDHKVNVNLYNISKYDEVIVVADILSEQEELFEGMDEALRKAGNSNITLAIWRD